MITIEEKLNLFTRIVYDKVEKQNADAINKFNQECGSIIQEKTEEFTKQAEIIEKQIEKEGEKEKLQIISKAKIQGKKLVIGKNNDIFNDAVKSVLECAKTFTDTEQYRSMLFKDISSAIRELNDSTHMELCLTEKDAKRYREDIEKAFEGRKLEISCNDSLVGGFVLIDIAKNMKIDMSYVDRVNSSRDIIGERLFEILQ